MPDGKRGRPPKLNYGTFPRVTAKLVEYIEQYNSPRMACAFAGISIRTYYDWLEKGAKQLMEKEEHLEWGIKYQPTPYQKCMLEFYQKIEMAVAEYQRVKTERMRGAGQDDWRCHFQELQARCPAEFTPAVFKVEADVTAFSLQGDPEIAKAVGDIMARRKQDEIRKQREESQQ